MQKATMGNTKIRKLTKFAGGASYGIIIPIEFIRHLGWRERQKLDVTIKGKQIIIKDWKK